MNNGTYSVEFWRSDMEAFGWLPYLDAIVSSGDLVWRKPHPLLFERALEMLSVSARDAVMVGDVPEIDVAGAKALGLTTVWKTNGSGLADTVGADYRIDRLAELLELDILKAR